MGRVSISVCIVAVTKSKFSCLEMNVTFLQKLETQMISSVSARCCCSLKAAGGKVLTFSSLQRPQIPLLVAFPASSKSEIMMF